MGKLGKRAYRDPTSWLEDDNGCWVWQRSCTKVSGHAQAWNGRYMDHAHRLTYADTYGPIPDGHDLHHKCHNPACVNPDHMEVLTVVEHSTQHRKLSDGDFIEIKHRIEAGDRQVDIAADFGISQVRVSQIKRGIGTKTWEVANVVG